MLRYQKNGVETTEFDLQIGAYQLVETFAPEPYVLKEKPVSITVTSDRVTYDEGTAISANNPGGSFDVATKTYTLTVSNAEGVVLPSTGGSGTRHYNLLAGMLFVLAGVLIVMKKKLQVKQC